MASHAYGLRGADLVLLKAIHDGVVWSDGSTVPSRAFEDGVLDKLADDIERRAAHVKLEATSVDEMRLSLSNVVIFNLPNREWSNRVVTFLRSMARAETHPTLPGAITVHAKER